LPTPLRELTHGVYCDEFAEYQYKDMMARSRWGLHPVQRRRYRILPERAGIAGHRVCQPHLRARLPHQDYENGFRVARLGLRQKFIRFISATAALSPRVRLPAAFRERVRQRTRWITGIGLQSWEFHSFGETIGHAYWFWRDRKSLVGNIVGPLTNLLFLYGVVTLVWAMSTHHTWGLGKEPPGLAPESRAGLTLQLVHTGIRIWVLLTDLRMAIRRGRAVAGRHGKLD